MPEATASPKEPTCHQQMDPMDNDVMDHEGASLHWEHENRVEHRTWDLVSECRYHDEAIFLLDKHHPGTRAANWDGIFFGCPEYPPALTHFLGGRNPLISDRLYLKLNQMEGRYEVTCRG